MLNIDSMTAFKTNTNIWAHHKDGNLCANLCVNQEANVP